MPYIYIGEQAIYHGRPLFRILANLKNFGVGRVVYRQSEYEAHPEHVHFYRVLHAQAMLDTKTLEGNVVTERVFKSLRAREPCILSKEVTLPDFRLVPKEEEAAFCQMHKIRDYDPLVDAPKRPKYVTMGPTLHRYLSRSRSNEIPVELPTETFHSGDVILEDEVRPHKLAHFIDEEFATHKDFSVDDIPASWNHDRLEQVVGVQKWHGFIEGPAWELQKQRIEEEMALKSGQQES